MLFSLSNYLANVQNCLYVQIFSRDVARSENLASESCNIEPKIFGEWGHREVRTELKSEGEGALCGLLRI